MRAFSIFFVIITILFSCEKSSNISSSGYTAMVAGYDLNCSTCILSFPFDSTVVRKELGSSPENLYYAVNLYKNDLKIGQMLKVEVRKAEPEELLACLTLYPSTSYRIVYVTNVKDFGNFTGNDTLLLQLQECSLNTENQAYICFESVTNDSRCPEGAACFWAGDAKVKFKYIRPNETPAYFNLNTNISFTNDTIIDGFRFTLHNLFPYPTLKYPVDQKEYKAELVIQKVSE